MLNIEDLHDILPFLSPRTITRASAAQFQSKSARTMKIKARNSRSEFIGQIQHVQWVLDIYTSLLAPAQLIKDGFCINLHDSGCTILDYNHHQLASVHEVGSIYPIDLAIVQSGTTMSTILEPTFEDLQEQLRGMSMAMAARPTYNVMHQCLEHLNVTTVHDLACIS